VEGCGHVIGTGPTPVHIPVDSTALDKDVTEARTSTVAAQSPTAQRPLRGRIEERPRRSSRLPLCAATEAGVNVPGSGGPLNNHRGTCVLNRTVIGYFRRVAAESSSGRDR
jgi:hypothetical protein